MSARDTKESPMGKFLITSALPYVNGVKHLGNLAGSLLPADIHARFRRQTGHEVLFLCGTDEHGTPDRARSQEAGPAGRRVLRAPARGAGRHLSSLRPVVRSFLAHLGRRQPAPDPGNLPPARCRGLSSRRARSGRPIRRPTGASCPTATSSAPAPLRQPERPRRPVRKLHAAARPGRSHRRRARRSPARPTSSSARRGICS